MTIEPRPEESKHDRGPKCDLCDGWDGSSCCHADIGSTVDGEKSSEQNSANNQQQIAESQKTENNACDSVVGIETKEEFDTKTQTGVVLVCFFAPLCNPSRVQLYLLETIVAAEVAGNALICKVNVAKFPSVAGQFQEDNRIPILVLLKEDSVVWRWFDVQSEGTILAAIDNELPVSLRRKRIPRVF